MLSRFCNRCGQMLPANATTCPRCNAPVAPPPSATPAAAAPVSTGTPVASSTEGLPSARRSWANCHAAMRWIGHYSLRATSSPGSAAAAPGAAVEMAETLLPFSLYYCQTCGKFDFYYPGT